MRAKGGRHLSVAGDPERYSDPLSRFLAELSPTMAVIMGFSFLVWLVSVWLDSAFVSISSIPLTVIGAALSIFLGFRNNAVYERYWEARILWGRLVNASRTLVRQLTQFTPPRHEGSCGGGRGR